MSKLRRIHVIIIGCTACVLVAAGLYFLVIKKATERVDVLEKDLQEQTAIYARKPAAERQLAEVKLEYNRQLTEYMGFMRAKMPALTFADRPQGMIALWKEQIEVLGPMVQRWPAKTGVQLTSNVAVPAPPTDPNAIAAGYIPVSLGTFSVRGDFGAIMAHVRKWNDFNRLVILGPVSISGPSPGMTAQYPVTVLLVPLGEAGPSFQMGSASVASNSGTQGQ